MCNFQGVPFCGGKRSSLSPVLLAAVWASQQGLQQPLCTTRHLLMGMAALHSGSPAQGGLSACDGQLGSRPPAWPECPSGLGRWPLDFRNARDRKFFFPCDLQLNLPTLRPPGKDFSCLLCHPAQSLPERTLCFFFFFLQKSDIYCREKQVCLPLCFPELNSFEKQWGGTQTPPSVSVSR